MINEIYKLRDRALGMMVKVSWPSLTSDSSSIKGQPFSLYSTNFSLQNGLEEMLAYAFDERELIRTTAIQLLSRYTIGHDKIKGALLEVVEYHYDEYDLRYAVESLQVLFPNDCRKWVLGVKEDLESKGGDQLIVDRIGVVLMSLA